MVIRENTETHKEENEPHLRWRQWQGLKSQIDILGSYLRFAPGTATHILCDSVSSSVKWGVRTPFTIVGRFMRLR